jgi:hypothetical protein
LAVVIDNYRAFGGGCGVCCTELFVVLLLDGIGELLVGFGFVPDRSGGFGLGCVRVMDWDGLDGLDGLFLWCPPLLWWLWVARPCGTGGIGLRLRAPVGCFTFHWD